jgi:ABC-type transport system substrate-binding protein
MKYASDGSVTQDIAESYNLSEDGLTYTFKLKPEIYFHDGIALSSEDIAFTIEKIQDPILKSQTGQMSQ